MVRVSFLSKFVIFALSFVLSFLPHPILLNPPIKTASTFHCLAPPAFVFPLKIELDPFEQKTKDLLAKKKISLPEAPAERIIRKLQKALELCIQSQKDSALFIEKVLNLDAQYGQDFLRLFPIINENQRWIGVNLFNNNGAILHLIIQTLDPEPDGPLAPQEPQEAKILDFKLGERKVALYLSDSKNNHEEEWIGKLKDLKEVKKHLPVPLRLIDQSQEKIQRFLSEVPEKVEDLLLNPGRNTTFKKFLAQYPETKIVFEEAFPQESKNPNNPISRILDANKPKAFVVTFMNQILQQIFLYHFTLPTDGVADFSHFHPPGEPPEVTRFGPDAVKALLDEFMRAVDKARKEAKVEDFQKIRFRKSPVFAFGEWLKREPEKKSLVFETVQDPSEPGFTLDQGVLIFDVDKTLLAKGENFQGINKPEMFHKLVDLISIGVPLRIISGNAAREQYIKLLEPIEKHFKAIRKSHLLKNVEMFTSTGSVRIYFDENKGEFVRDDHYDIQKILHPDEEKNISTVEDFKKLAEQLHKDLPPLWKELFKDGGFKEESKVSEISGSSQGDPFALTNNNFKGPAPTLSYIYMEMRDGQSLTIKGEGLQTKTKKPGQGDKTEKPTFAVTLSEKGAQCFTKKGVALQAPDKNFRSAILDLLEHWKTNGIDKQREIYSKFHFATGGDTSIDITLEGQNKASAAHYIFKEQANGKKFQREDSVYFGDEFTYEKGCPGNDLSLSDPSLKGMTLVHVGEKKLEKSPFKILTRKMGSKLDVKYEDALREIQDLYYILDSLDGSEQMMNLVRDQHGLRSYTVALFYRHYPIVVGTLFPQAQKGVNNTLFTNLNTPSVSSAPSPFEAYLPLSSKDNDPKNAQQNFVFQLKQWLERKGVKVPQGNIPGSMMLLQLIYPSAPVFLVRQGHAPKSKLGIVGHAYLLGAHTFALLGSEKGAVCQPLFPLNPKALASESERYATIYSFVSDPATRDLMEKILGFLRESAGEQEIISWVEPNLVLETAI